MIKIEIFSDPICPWCFIGKTWLYRAYESDLVENFEVIWKPFQLNPEMPISGMLRTNYLKKKFGSHENAKTAYASIIETKTNHNIKINFNKISRTPNTFDAHRLIYWSKIEGIQNEIVSALFKAYFQDGQDIGDKANLIEIASSCGFNRELIICLLHSDHEKEFITTTDLNALKIGITGVPIFIVDETYAVSGAQTTAFWKKVFEEADQNQTSQY